MFSLKLLKNSYFVYLNKQILFTQNMFYLNKQNIINNKKLTWFLKIQKDLYHFGLKMPFNK
jgi:hypothetical protein